MVKISTLNKNLANPPVILNIPYEESLHLMEMVKIHLDYKKNNNSNCFKCEALANHLSKAIRNSQFIEEIKK